MKQVSVSQYNTSYLKAFQPNDEIYEIYNYNKKLKSKIRKNKRYISISETSLEKKLNNLNPTQYLNIQSNFMTTNKTINSFSKETIPVIKKYFSNYQHFNHLNNKHTFRQVNYLLIPGNSNLEKNHYSVLTTAYDDKLKTTNTYQQTEDNFKLNDSFDEELYNKLKFFDNLSNFKNDNIHDTAEYIVKKINNKNNKVEIEKPNCIIHNVFLRFVLKEIKRKIEIRNINNEIVSVDYVYNLLQNEIEKLKGGIQNSIKKLKQINIYNRNNNIQNKIGKDKKNKVTIVEINKYLNTDFLSYFHFGLSKQKNHNRQTSGQFTSETKNSSNIHGYSDEEDVSTGRYINYNNPYNEDSNNKYRKITIRHNNDIDSDKGNYSNLIDKSSFEKSNIPTSRNNIKENNDDNENNNKNRKYFKKNKYAIPNIIKKGIYINNNNIEVIDKSTGKPIYNSDGSFNISFYDNKGNLIKNPDINDKNIIYYDKNGKEIKIEKKPKIKLYDKTGKIIENPNLDDSNITFYDESGKIINTEARIPIQVYDKNGNLIEEINNNTGYYDSNGNLIEKPKDGFSIYNPEEEIIIPEGHKLLYDKEGNEVIVPNEFKFIENNKGELVLVDDKGKEINKEEFLAEKIMEKNIIEKIKKKKGKKKKYKKKIVKNEKGEEMEFYESFYEEESEEENEHEEIKKGKKNKKKKKKKKKKKNNEIEELYENDLEEIEIEDEIEVKDENGNVKKEIVKKIIKVKVEKPNDENTNDENTNDKNTNDKNINDKNKEKQKFSQKIHERKKLNFKDLSHEENNNNDNDLSSQRNNLSSQRNNLNSQRRKKNVNIKDTNEDNNDNDISDSDDSYIPNFNLNKKDPNYNEFDEEKYRKYKEEKLKHLKEKKENVIRNQKAYLTHNPKNSIKSDPEILQLLLEEARLKKLHLDNNNSISDEDIYKNFNKNSPLFLEWIKLRNKYDNEKEKENNTNHKFTHQFNYRLVGQGEFLVYKGKNYFEKKEEKEDKIPQEFVNWIKREIKKIEDEKYSKSSLIKEQNKDKNITVLPQVDNPIKITHKNKFVKPKREKPKKKLNMKGLKSITYFEDEMKEEEMPNIIKRESSSDSSEEIDKTKSLKYLFEQIQKLKNLPPDEYAKQINSLVDFQLDNTDIMLNRKHADRINRFVQNLNENRKTKINYQKLISNKLMYLPPITIKSIDTVNRKEFNSYLDKFRASENIDVNRSQVTGVIENIKY